MDIQKLAEALRLWPRSKAWKLMLQDPNMPPTVRSLLRHHVEVSRLWERAQRDYTPDIPRYFKKSPSRGRSGPCTTCGEPLPHPVNDRRHMWLMRQKYWGKRWWANKSPEYRRSRTKAASEARWAKHWDEKLKAVNPRIIKLLGWEKVLWLLKNHRLPL